MMPFAWLPETGLQFLQSRARLSSVVVWCLLCLSLVATGCGPVLQQTLPLPNPAGHRADEEVFTLLAGVSEVDITPPAGFPIAGYSTNGQVSVGFRTRLKARAFFLQSPDHAPIVIFQTDLLSGSSLIHRRVASALAPTLHVDLNQVMMTATHTHGGPGQFMDSDFYNEFASSQMGMDPWLVDFLVERLVRAGLEAFETRAPAQVATGRIDVWGFTRNRSLDPHVHNPELADKSMASQRVFHTINPALDLIRIDVLAPNGRYYPRGVLGFFSIHGTAVPNKNDVYSADVWAYLSGELSRQISRSWNPPWPVVAGFSEATHGDAAPALRFGMAGYIEARRIGTGIAQKAFELFSRLEDALSARIDLRAALVEVDALAQNPELPSLCTPRVGSSLLGGAKENSTPIIELFPAIAPGQPRWLRTRGCQGVKRPVLGQALQPLVLKAETFPRVIPTQLLRIGGMLLLGLPFEVTTQAGRRISTEVLQEWKAAGGDAVTVTVTSVANGYFGYATTAGEYSRQFYEGGHTLFGPVTTSFLAGQGGRLARALAQRETVLDAAPARSFSLHTHTFNRPALAPKTRIMRRSLSTPEFLHADIRVEQYWKWQWSDVHAAQLGWDAPLVRVEVQGPDGQFIPLVHEGVPVNDQGYDIEVRSLGGPSDEGRYELRWYNPVFDGGVYPFRFVILPRGDEVPLVSPEFR